MFVSDATQDSQSACTCCLPRRGFLKGLAAASLASASSFGAQAQAQSAARRIDVYHHVLPPLFAETAKAKNMLPPVVASLTIQRSIEDMDRSGVATSILSIPS